MEGGFDNNEPEYEETHSIVILPDYVTLPFPSVELPEKVQLIFIVFLLFLHFYLHFSSFDFSFRRKQ